MVFNYKNMIIVTSIFFTFFTFFLFLEGHIVIYKRSLYYYNKYQSINTLVKTQYSNSYVILYVVCTLILKALYITLCQVLNKTLVKLDNNQYELTYVIKGKLYKMIVNPTVGPSNVLLITDSDDNDMTDIVSPYLGPTDNFFGTSIKPTFFKVKTLTFELSNGKHKTFNSNDYLTFV